MPDQRNFTFICGPDDFLVGRLGRERYESLAAEAPDEFSRETINGFAANVGEVEGAVNRFREAVLTVSMFGGRRLVWLRDINFLADTVTGRAEGTLRQVGDLQEILAGVRPDETAVLITAAPIDRRRAFPKWCEKHADFRLVGAGGDSEALVGVALAEARELGVAFAPGAVELLVARIGANSRLLVEETRKLATYALPPAGPDDETAVEIAEAHVAELTPNVAEGYFFEVAEAFFSGDLRWTLTALRRHFFAGGNARPVLAALQNRNRLLLQIRALIDAGEARPGNRGLEGLNSAASRHAPKFAGAAEKSSFHLFTQNPWYVGKLAKNPKLPGLSRLIDNQRELLAAFEEIVRRPADAEDVLRDLSVRCLT